MQLPKKFTVKQILIAATFIALLLIPLVRFWDIFCCSINIDEYTQKYSTSQYILNEGSPQKISDSELYVYAGYAYMRGEDPTTINFEHPPLAKYFYGLSYWLTGNPYIFNILLYFGILWLFYQLSGLLTKQWLLKLIGLGVLGSFSLIQVHLRYALLDLPLLFGYLVFFYGLLSNLPRKKNAIISGVGLGIAASVKYPFPLVGLLLGFLVIDALKNKTYFTLIVSSFFGVLIYMSSYLFYFLHGNSLFDWIAFEKYRFSWFMHKTEAPKFLVLQTLFTGSFETWWSSGEYETTAHWSITWPISFIGAFFSLIVAGVKKHYEAIVLVSFPMLQLLIYGVGAAASDRFFITLLPFWVLGVVYLCDMILKKKNLLLSNHEKI